MKNGILVLMVMVALGLTATAFANENCTPEKKQAVCLDAPIKEKVDWACSLVESKGRDSLKEIRRLRYDCCGEPNYVWINDLHPKMVMHPIKPALDNTDLTGNKDPDGKALFVAFVDAVKAKPAGDWVDYKWTKFGEKEPSPKKSWVKKCKVAGTAEEWVVGSGTWK